MYMTLSKHFNFKVQLALLKKTLLWSDKSYLDMSAALISYHLAPLRVAVVHIATTPAGQRLCDAAGQQ